MVKFLIQRPIAVIMAFLAFVIIGVVTYKAIPVSLLPSTDIPRITVRVTGENMSARELENEATASLRRSLQQTGGLTEIISESHDGYATIRLEFAYGVDMDLAFIEANEKVDAVMSGLPRDMQRPKVVKGSATDIPVLYLHITPRNANTSEGEFLEMAKVAENVVRRRIEQLPEVAIADISGVPSRMIRISPIAERTEPSGITPEIISRAVEGANRTPGSMTVREGYYEYNINVSNRLRTPQDVADIRFERGGRLIRLGDIAEISVVEPEPAGIVSYNGKRGVALAVIKQGEENIDAMKDALASTVDALAEEYPQYLFSVSRNQTDLLDFTISNLVQNLVLGLILVFLITAIFMGDLRTPFIIGISIIVSLMMTFLTFYLFRVSLNIVSLSGLILAVGMMIDNSVIVTENITQWRQRGFGVEGACERGATEMITPLLSSSLTTVAVFVPLIFMSGIAGAIFSDQAFSISAGLAMSYIAGIALLPVLYRLFFTHKNGEREWKTTRRLDSAMERIYSRGIHAVFSHKGVWISLTLLSIPLCIILFNIMQTERMPRIDHTESMARIDWNEEITIAENARRTDSLASLCTSLLAEHSATVGVQDFLIDDGSPTGRTESELYLRALSPEGKDSAINIIMNILNMKYPSATARFYPPENVFEKVFSSAEPDLEIRLARTGRGAVTTEEFRVIERAITETAGKPSASMPLRQRREIIPDYNRMALYNVDPAEVERVIENALRVRNITTLRSFDESLPVALAPRSDDPDALLAESMVPSRQNQEGKRALIPLRQLVGTGLSEEFSTVMAGKNGEYMRLSYKDLPQKREILTEIDMAAAEAGGWETEFSGAIFSNSRMMKELTVILGVSVVLMYFILCAQFGSFLQPLIVLLEIPIDTAFALLALWMTGHTLNLMSAIGIIVTCGIVVNDSILKLDAINTLRREGMPLMEAIHTGGARRLRPIVMTSLTTILAMVPMLFTDDMGSRLQRPLAIAMIGSMTVGTIISVFIIPLIYFLIYRKHGSQKA